MAIERVDYTVEFLTGVTAEGKVVYFYSPKTDDIRWTPHIRVADNIHSNRRHLMGRHFLFEVPSEREVTDDEVVAHMSEKVQCILNTPERYRASYVKSMPVPHTIQVISLSGTFTPIDPNSV